MTEAIIRGALDAHAAGNLAEAERLYGEYLRLNPSHFPTLYALSVLYMQDANYPAAERSTAEALRFNPRSAETYYTRGNALYYLQRHAEAVFCFEKALAINPRYADALVNRSAALMALNRFEEALRSVDAALALDPQIFSGWNNRGWILQKMGRSDEALAALDRALAISQTNAEVFVNRGEILFQTKRYEEAVEAYEKARAISPDFHFLLGNLVHARLHACDWSTLAEEKAAIREALGRGLAPILPFVHLVVSDSPEEQRQSAESWIRMRCPPVQPLWRGERYRHDRIRLAYVSSDFHAHATMQLGAGVFEAHDRARFEVIAISLGPDDGSAMRARLATGFNRFVDLRTKSDSEAAQQMHRMEIDIAVDLSGHTQHQRLGVLSFRPAPVQAQWLGYPGTLGAEFIDYLIADRVVVPADEQRFYAEKLVYLPDQYQANDRNRAIAEETPSRAELGLPEQGFVFCCFNNSSKITPEMFAIWMRLLAGIEGSVLWLLETNEAAVRNLRREASAAGIGEHRIVFAPRASAPQHLARHRRADLFLDTLPYGAHTTASDSLWAGLPVLTRAGSTFAGRVAASLLQSSGLPELVTQSAEDYERLARELARNSDRLGDLRARLHAVRDTAPLFDTARITRHLEQAYVAMWERQQRGEPPASFAVAAHP